MEIEKNKQNKNEKIVLGLDIGTNSIGWALIRSNFEDKLGKIIDMGSRIIPMSAEVLSNFDAGNKQSQTAERTSYRSMRKLNQRFRLRRERLHRALNILGFLPKHYSDCIDFEKRFGQFIDNKEPKIAYLKDGNKHEFLFENSYQEMLEKFSFEGIVPKDITLYYLRQKALKEKISKEELSWVLLNFNQKRGYYQARDDEEMQEEEENKKKEFCALKVVNVKESESNNSANKIWYEVELENGLIYKRQSNESLEEWIGMTKEFIVTTTSNQKVSLRLVDSEKDWIAIKKKTEKRLSESGCTVGEWIFEHILKNPSVKIRGKLIQTIDRKFYKDELIEILKKQIEFHYEFADKELLKKCIKEIYRNNEARQKLLEKSDLIHLIVNDIIFYQRPLKSQKHTIANCKYEIKSFKKDNQKQEVGIKVVSKSHPIFEEFRIWQFINNLKILEIKDTKDVDVTNQFIENEDRVVELFDFLYSKKEINQKDVLKWLKLSEKSYRWNYVENNTYPTAPTRAEFINRFKKVESENEESLNYFLSNNNIEKLWHIAYSVTDKEEFEKALKTFIQKHNLARDKEGISLVSEDEFVKIFSKLKPFDAQYAAFSLKALNKIVPLMRMGKYWDENKIIQTIQERIDTISSRIQSIIENGDNIEEVCDDEVTMPCLIAFLKIYDNKKGLNETQVSLKVQNINKGLNVTQASYVVYNRHAESADIQFWKNYNDINTYLGEFKQHSLRNPIVEQIVLETLRTVRDIWKNYLPEENFDEIHLELGREMKNNAEKRKKMTASISENQKKNDIIRKVLMELQHTHEGMNNSINPNSIGHNEILKIYDEGVHSYSKINNTDKRGGMEYNEVEKLLSSNNITSADIKKYRTWLEQGYVSPYTKKTIPLSELFTTKYQIEHIIPKSRYFDNSLGNKVICESEVNLVKGNMTAFEFIKSQKGKEIQLTDNKTVNILSEQEYIDHCKTYFKGNKHKIKLLLSEEVPESFISRQLNDTRYISKYVKSLLSHIVREEGEEAVTSINLISVTGSITSLLKNDWGLNDVWNTILSPRFERMNQITNTEDYYFKKDNKWICTVPEEFRQKFNKKRIDHRHHALDALVIACVTRNHVNYLNAIESKKEDYRLVRQLRRVEEKKNKDGFTYNVSHEYLKPWDNFTVDVKKYMNTIIPSFKQNSRVINRTINWYYKWVEENGIKKKKLVKQEKKQWAIRKPLHKETIVAKVKVRLKKNVNFNQALEVWKDIVDKEIRWKIKQQMKLSSGNIDDVKKYFKKNPIYQNNEKIKKLDIYYNEERTAIRKLLDEKFTRGHLNSVLDVGLKRILNNHVKKFTIYDNGKSKEDFKTAFGELGLIELNKSLVNHHPIHYVHITEKGSQFSLGTRGCKNKKYVEAAKGTNLFFAIYTNGKKRAFETIPLRKMIEYQQMKSENPMEYIPPVPVNKTLGEFLFVLSPNDLVYMPTEDEIENQDSININDLKMDRIYKFVSCTDKEAHFFQARSAYPIVHNKEAEVHEFGKLNKIGRAVEEDKEGDMIKNFCWKLEVNRIGKIQGLIK